MQLNAHGCGMWHGWIYPNCAEALDAAVRNGFKNIEVDVSVTSDGIFVIGHEVAKIAELDGKTFLSQNCDCEGTPLSLDSLLKLVARNPDIRIMIDFLPSWRGMGPELVQAAVRHLLASEKSDRFLFEVYGEDDAESAMSVGFENIMLWLGNRARRFEPLARVASRKADFCLANGIKFVSLGKPYLQHATESIKRLRTAGISIWSAGWNSFADLKRAETLGVDVATVDWLVPGGSLKNFLWRTEQKTWRFARRISSAFGRRLHRCKPTRGKRVFLVGVFDLLHFGHFELFRRAKALAGPGGRLTVAVQDDDFVLKYKPTANIVVPLAKRIAMIETLRTVDRVVIYTDVDEIVKELDFDTFVVGGDQTHAGFQRAIDWCRANGREVVRLSRTPGVSSSELRAGIAERR